LAVRALSIGGLLIATLGQWGLETADRSLTDPPRTPLLALLLGAGLFALGTAHVSTNGSREFCRKLDSPGQVFRGVAALAAVAVGGLLLLLVLYRETHGSKTGLDLIFWLVALAAFAIPFALRSHPPRLSHLRDRLQDLAVILILIGIFLGVTVQDLNDPYYSAIGDEYDFYSLARDIATQGMLRSPFSQEGVYGAHPVLNSVYQAAVMFVFGKDHFGWMLSSVLSVAVTIPAVYLIGATLGDRRVAVVAATLYSFSHYLFAFAHVGKNNIHALAPTVWALAFFVLGLRKRSAFLLYLAGIIAGLGFYTLYSARAVVPIIGLFVLTQGGWRRRLGELWPLALGLVLAVAPILAVNGKSVFTRMIFETPVAYEGGPPVPLGRRILDNASINLPAFNYNPHHVTHYVSGGLLDPITAVLMVLGLALALRYVHFEAYRLLLLWVVIGVTATGVLSPYTNTTITRLHFVVPPLVLLAGFACRSLWQTIQLPINGGLRRSVGLGAVLALSVAVLALNLQRFWIETPKRLHLSGDAVAIGLTRSGPCAGDPEHTVIASLSTDPVLKRALASYTPDGTLPRLVNYNSLVPGRPFPIDSARCVIFVQPLEGVAHLAVEDLSRRYPSGRLLTFTDRAGLARVGMFVVDATG
jgi:4-amino-4-deoxy-L-arabinose transferase-like glycosyltransferase